MSEQYDEHEQSERVKQWLIKNGTNILTGLLLAVSAIYAWQWWQGRQLQQGVEAANQYQTFIQAVKKNDSAKATVLGEAFIKNYQKSDLAFLAALHLAKYQQDQGKPSLALKALDQAASVAHSEQNRELVLIRKAQLNLSQLKPTEAKKILATFKPVFFTASYAELQGDIAVSLDQREQAAQAYQSALSKLDPAAGSRTLIEMKLADAGGVASNQTEIH